MGIGVPHVFRNYNGSEYTNRIFAEYCDGLEIRRELTAPCMLQENNPVESALNRTIRAGLATGLKINKFFPDVPL